MPPKRGGVTKASQASLSRPGEVGWPHRNRYMMLS